MDPTTFIPDPETIPAPVWVFTTLETVTFLLHLVVVNFIVGSGLIILYERFLGSGNENDIHYPLVKKIPTGFALGVNFGVAPLLFIQVVFGHLFYTSSVLMATFWILIIPFLIIAYYGAYIHARKYDTAVGLSKFSILMAVIILLYIAFMFVNNNSMMEQPAVWEAYFNNRGGTFLNLSDLTIYPRYLHFVVASVAIAALVLSFLWNYKAKKGEDKAEMKMKKSLKIFAIATAVQVGIGLWYLMAQPREIILNFMGGDIISSVLLLLGVLMAILALVFGFTGKLKAAAIHAFLTVLFMIIIRANLREMYLNPYFKTESLELSPQYSVLALFLVVFIAGLYSVYYMVKAGFFNNTAKEA